MSRKPLLSATLLGLLLLSTTGCVVAPPYYSAGAEPAPVYVAPSYPAPGIGWIWMSSPGYGWGWRHPHRGWHRGRH